MKNNDEQVPFIDNRRDTFKLFILIMFIIIFPVFQFFSLKFFYL